MNWKAGRSKAETEYMVGGPKLLMSFCAALDVLGFSKRTRKAFNSGQGPALFNALYAAIADAAQSITDRTFEDLSEDPPSWTHKFFTDNLLLAFATYTMNSEGLGEDELGDVILDVVDYQLAMALHGFFVRGGIAYGPLHVSNHVVFGPALLDAHDIEESVARYPRVVLARDVVKIARYHLRFYHPFGDSPHNTTLLVADDRRVFVSYLCGLILDQGVQWDALLRHATTFAAHFMNAKWSPPMRSSTFW